jgi:peptidoglycan/LPS O-acetylase OafA/YrhL
VFAPASGLQIVHSTVLSSLLYAENWHIVAAGGVGGAGLIRDPAGCCVALLVQCGLLPRIPKPATILASLAVLVLALHPLPLVFQLTATTLLGSLIVAGLSQHELWPLTTAPARWLGQRSYALYLWHPFVGIVFALREVGRRLADRQRAGAVLVHPDAAAYPLGGGQLSLGV